jgi:hypothetical protein
MVIDQRNAGASVTPTGTAYTLDRWNAFCNVSSKFSVQQSTTAPTGFVNSLKVTSASAYTIGSSEFTAMSQNIEGFNVADLGFGTANAKTVTLSFQVYSSLTGTFGGSFANGGGTRSYPFTYSIPVANTWTTISITIAGDTTGTWATNNTSGLQVFFGLGCGSSWSGTAGAWAGSYYLSATGATSVVGTSSATFYITGVQLEVGTAATSFDYRPYGTELVLCERYTYVTNPNEGTTTLVTAGTTADGTLQFPVTMRTTPTLTTSGAASGFLMQTYNDTQVGSAVSISAASVANARLSLTAAGGTWTAGQAGRVYFGWSSSGQKLIFSAEL